MSGGASESSREQDSRVAALQAELARMQQERDRAEHEREQYRKLYTLVLYELERIKRQLFGKKAETVAKEQIQLAFGPVFEALARAQHDAGAQTDVQAALEKLRAAAQQNRNGHAGTGKPKKPHGRRDLSESDLPVETVVLEPPERQLPGGEQLIKIGEEVSEHLDRRHASTVRVRVVRPKYKQPGTETTVASSSPDDDPAPSANIVIAELPARPIARSIAGPGLIAHILVQKFGDHVPLHRQEVIFRREGVHLPRSTLASIVQGSTSLLKRITDAMWEDTRRNAVWVSIDATGVLVLAKEQCKRGHFWVVVAERDHVLFRYTKKHDGTVPADLLAGFSGYVLADAASVYHELYRNEPAIIEVGCFAHARRKFFDALTSDRERALVGIGFIGLLYDAHRAASDPKTGIADTEKRKAAAQPVLNKLYQWVEQQRPLLDDDAPIKKAMNYLVNHRVALERFLHDGRLRLDNNLSELELRRQVIGRRNWTFCGSDDGAHWNEIATSLIASCALHGIEPWAYLRDVLILLPSWPARRVLELCPKLWNHTRQQPQAQQLLASLRLLGRFDDAHADNYAASPTPSQ